MSLLFFVPFSSFPTTRARVKPDGLDGREMAHCVTGTWGRDSGGQSSWGQTNTGPSGDQHPPGLPHLHHGGIDLGDRRQDREWSKAIDGVGR